MVSSKFPAALLLLVLASSLVDGKKIARVKAGKVHREHDPVHIVVNKVG